MCGIAGFLDTTATCPAERLTQQAQAMARAIAHRGPDDEGVWTDPVAGIALAHRRLAIIDLSQEGHQPMASPSGRFTMVFNGEIYNYKDLRDRLERAGHAPAWRGHSDTEVILAACEAWGVNDAINASHGMFAVAIWDAADRVLLLARDRIGEKPLYYGWQGKEFLFGSELKALEVITAGFIDIPNERSSHATPTPRGGGLAIVIASLGAIAVLTIIGVIPVRLFAALAGGGLGVAAVGFVDDRRPLSVRTRFAVHLLAAAWAVACAGPVRDLAVGSGTLHLGGFGYAICTIGIVWFLNIFNFMDGIDGIAASEAVFVSGSLIIIVKLIGGPGGVAAACCAIGSASVGFLLWNVPPAKIFMGDVGSGYLGFAIAVFGLAVGRQSPIGSWTWLVLVGVFAVDSPITLARRYVRGESVAVAHRTHAYQWAARRLGHGQVTASIAVINLTLLLPCALAMAAWPMYAPWLLAVAFCPLAGLALAFGTGAREVRLNAGRG